MLFDIIPPDIEHEDSELDVDLSIEEFDDDVDQLSRQDFSHLEPSESIAAQKFRLLRERLEEPTVYIPIRDYSQKDNPEEDIDNPNLQLYMYRDSSAAKDAWVTWLEEVDEDQLAQMLLDKDEYKDYLLYKQIVKEEEEEYLLQEEARVIRRCTETPWFHATLPARLNDFTFNISFSEMLFRKVLTDYQTNIWRKPYTSFDQSGDFSFTDPTRDLDFYNPLSITSGFILKPASRPYNLSFYVKAEKDGITYEKISSPKSVKDLTTAEDISYTLTTAGYSVIEIKDVTPKDHVCWEIDLRVSPRNDIKDGNESLIPNPRNYKKIDSNSKLGRRLIRSLKENPYHEWIEVSWEYTPTSTSNEQNSDSRVVALVRPFKNFLYWCYLDRSTFAPKNKKRQRIIYPQLTPITQKNGNNKLITIGYTIRYQDYTEINQSNIHKFLIKRELDAVLSRLGLSGFTIVHRSEHDLFGCLQITLLHNNFLTPKQRYLAKVSDQ